jgi:cation transport ATPase
MLVMYLPNAPWTMEQAAWLLIGPATAVQFLAGRRFYRAAIRAAIHGSTSMDTLVVVGTSAAWAFSVLVTVAPGLLRSAGIEPQTYFDSSTAIIGLILTGRWLEARAKGQTVGAVKALDRAAGQVRSNRSGGRRGRRSSGRGSRRRSDARPTRRDACPSMAGSSTARRRSTNRCSPANRSRPRRVPAPR